MCSVYVNVNKFSLGKSATATPLCYFALPSRSRGSIIRATGVGKGAERGKKRARR